MTRKLVRIVKWGLVAFAAFLGLSCILFGLAQTDVGKRKLASWLTSAITRGSDVEVNLEQFEGLVPFDFRLTRLVIEDRQGILLQLENFTFRWAPVSLLKGRFLVKEISAETVNVERLPAPAEVKERKGHPWPEWPPKIPPIRIEHLRIGRLTLGEPILGERAVLTVDGQMSARDPDPGITGTFLLNSLEGPETRTKVAWSMGEKPPELALDAEIEEEGGGLISALLGLGDLGPLSVELRGEGPIQTWEGRLIAKAENLGSIASTVQLTPQGRIGLRGTGRLLTDQDIFPREIVSMTNSNEARFVVDVTYGSHRECIIQKFHVETGPVVLDLSGHVNLEKGSLEMELVVDADDLSSLSKVLGAEVVGRLDARGELSGSLKQPRTTLSFTLGGVEITQICAATMMGELKLELLGPIIDSFPGLTVEGKGRVQDLSVAETAKLPADRFDWAISASFPSRGLMKLRNLAIEAEDLTVELSGQFDPSDLVFEGSTVAEIRDLEGVASLLETELSGSGNIHADLEVNAKRSSVSAMISGRLNGLTPLPKILESVAGSEVLFEADLTLDEATQLRLSRLTVEMQNAALAGDGALDLSTQEVKGSGHIVMPKLSVWSELFGWPLGGALDVEVALQGSVSDPSLRVKASGRDVLLDNWRLERVAAVVQSQGLPMRSKGRVRVDLQGLPLTAQMSSDFDLKSRHLAFSNLLVEALGSEIRGNIRLDIDRSLVVGTLKGRASDLSSLSNILGEEYDGSAQLSAKLSEGIKGQDVALELRINELATPYGHSEAVALNAHLEDVLHDLSGKTELQVQKFHRDELQLASLTLMAEGRLEQASFNLEARGLYGDPFELQTRGSVGHTSAGDLLRLDALQGQYATHPFHLVRPLMIRRSQDGYLLDQADLQLHSGHLNASGLLGAERLSMEAKFDGLPLEMFQVVGLPQVTGTASGDIHISGRPDQPTASMRLVIPEVRLSSVPFQNLPSLKLAADGKLGDGRFKVDAQVEGLSAKPVLLSVLLPVVFSLSPFHVSMLSKGELGGQLSAEMELLPVMELLQLEGQEVRGHLQTRMSLAGTLERPVMAGDIQLRDGTYENIQLGTILRDVQAAIKLDGSRLLLERVRATDGETGGISAHGWLDLTDFKDLPFEVYLTLEGATLVRHRQFTASTDGDLKLSGTLEEAMLSGMINVGPAELRIPDRLPVDIPELEVVEINGPVEQSRQEGKVPPGRPPDLRLDLTMEIPGRVFVRGRGLDSEWKGNLKIKGSTRKPSIIGVLSVIRGYCDLFGKRFDVKKGDLNFDGNVPPSPNFDISAENRGKDITAFIRITGTPSSPTLDLESDPELPSDEILARVLFGRSVAEVSPVQALMLADAVATLAGGGTGALDLMGRARRLLNVDQLDIKQAEQGKETPSVGMGKYINENVYVEIEQGTGADSGQVSVEVELTPNITVESQAGADAQGGAGINLKWDY
jgi:translocation and assembly module TamB